MLQSEDQTTLNRVYTKEEFVLQDLFNRVIMEVLSEKTKQLKSIVKGEAHNPYVDSFTKCKRGPLRKAVYKKLLNVLNKPAKSTDDALQKLLLQDLSCIETKLDIGKSDKGSKGFNLFGKKGSSSSNKSEFIQSILENKKTLQIPGKESFYSAYYLSRLAESFNQGKNIWLMKVSGYNRGFGIELFEDLDTFLVHLNNFKEGYTENLDIGQSVNTGLLD